MSKKSKKRKRRIALVVLVLAAIGAWWYWHGRLGSKGKKQRITQFRVIRRDFRMTVLATGAVKPQIGAEVRVGARVSGKVEHLRANIGDAVKKGQVIAELEKADLEAAVSRRRAELRVAEARVADTKAKLKLAELQLKRQEALRKKDFTTQDAVDRARQQYDSAKVAVRLALRQVEAARAALRESRVKLSYTRITAPIDGIVATVATQEGETVSAGLRAPTFVTIIDLKRLQVDAFVDEVDIAKVMVGQPAFFTVDSLPGKEFRAKVAAIYPKAVIQDNVVNYDVVLEILSPYDGLLRPEMTANVTIEAKSRKGVLAVPAKAVHRVRGKNMVRILAHGRPVDRAVQVGWREGSWIEIKDGLKEGDIILLATK